MTVASPGADSQFQSIVGVKRGRQGRERGVGSNRDAESKKHQGAEKGQEEGGRESWKLHQQDSGLGVTQLRPASDAHRAEVLGSSGLPREWSAGPNLTTPED